MTLVLSRVDGETDADFDRLMESALFVWGYLGLLLGLVVLPCLGAWLTARWSRRKVLEPGGTVTAAVIAGAFVIVLPVIDLVVSGDPLVLGLVTQAVTLAVLLGAVFVGAGSIAGWALRAALRQTQLLGELTS